jgi:hypothetical protein
MLTGVQAGKEGDKKRTETDTREAGTGEAVENRGKGVKEKKEDKQKKDMHKKRQENVRGACNGHECTVQQKQV